MLDVARDTIRVIEHAREAAGTCAAKLAATEEKSIAAQADLIGLIRKREAALAELHHGGTVQAADLAQIAADIKDIEGVLAEREFTLFLLNLLTERFTQILSDIEKLAVAFDVPAAALLTTTRN